jgi:uncharacterized protein YkwD
MRRTAWIAGTAAVVALAGCGGTTGAPGPVADASPAQPVGTPAAIAATDGRLGPASAASSDAPGVEVSPGGRPDVREHEQPADRAGVGAAASCPGPELAPDVATMAAVMQATLCLVNAERIDRGLARLTSNTRLATAAQRYARDMVVGGYFSHTGRDGSDFATRLRRVGYIPAFGAWAIGENLAWGTGALATPAAIVRAWMNSPGHRANVLEPRYREIGLGIAIGNPAGAEGGGATYATEFGATTAPARTARKRAARTARHLLRQRQKR